MISFVNAKINIGLYITGTLPNGYHTLSTLFYPIGTENGTPENPSPFCDILELTPADKTEFIFTGNKIDCPEEKNLVCRSLKAFKVELEKEGGKFIEPAVRLEKHIPDGAGIGGGSADAAFTLRMLNNLHHDFFDDKRLMEIASRIGADCPFFICNRPSFATGIGDILTPHPVSLKGYWLLLLKNNASVSTAEAYRGIDCEEAPEWYPEILCRPVKEWRGKVENIFERSLFKALPEIAVLKESLYTEGADYASMSGSGSSVFGLFRSYEEALKASKKIPAAYKALIRCER